MLAFGREKLLYISTGDGGGTGDPFANAQDRSTLSGKVLRINPFRGCSGRHYCIPPKNPYSAPGGARGSIWLYGLRNPWRFSVDSATGDLWIADVGQDKYEEVTRVPYAERAWNLGWSCREGRSVYNASRCSAAATYHDPTIAYPHSRGEAVIGGYVYRGSTYASLLAGLYVFGDFVSGNVWVNGQGTNVRVGNVGANRLTAFGQDGTGELWATTLDGGLYQVVAAAA
jgi:glucose/arabinose dehydrogenase